MSHPGSHPIEEWEVLDLLSSLVAKSLVVYDEAGGRYRLIETLREYVEGKLLDSGDAEAAHRRHLDHYLALAEEAEPKLTEADQAVWFQRLDAEYDNLRAAFGKAGLAADEEAGYRLAGALGWFWSVRGHLSEARALLHEVLMTELSGRPSYRGQQASGPRLR